MCIDMLLQGALFTQVSPSQLLTIHDSQVIKFANYFTWYGSTDGYKLTLSVAILALITTLKSVQVCLLPCHVSSGHVNEALLGIVSIRILDPSTN